MRVAGGSRKQENETMMTRITIATAMLLGFAATVYAACPLCP